MKNIYKISLLIFLSLFPFATEAKELTQPEIQFIGDLIFKNECSGKDENLVTWNEGEDFMSLGIGHFIWYPEGKKGPFEEGFISLLEFLKKKEIKIPFWLKRNTPPPCPWTSRAEFFLQSKGNIKLQQLRELMLTTKYHQAEFIIKRLDNALNLILQQAEQEKKECIKRNFNYLVSSSLGAFILIDYINFKGLGISNQEKYNGKGWGVLQVLSEMPCINSEGSVSAFVDSAEKVLICRVDNSPVERNEKRWLQGWKKRVRSYLSIKF